MDSWGNLELEVDFFQKKNSQDQKYFSENLEKKYVFENQNISLKSNIKNQKIHEYRLCRKSVIMDRKLMSWGTF